MIRSNITPISEHSYEQDTPIMVSIVVATYNHEQYIGETIESFLMQKTNFRVEVLINDDASTDKTVQIVKKHEEKYPQLFVNFYQTVNQYSQGKKPWFNVLFPAAKGKYIALCEGDDYWIDPYKLQKQVDFLEANPDYNTCFHRVLVNFPHDSSKNYYSEIEQEITSILDLASFNYQQKFDYKDKNLKPKYNYIPTASVVFRNNLINHLPDWFYDSPFGDYPLHLLNSQKSKIYFINEVMAVYNVHSAGVWYSKDDESRHERYLKFLLIIFDKFDKHIENTVIHHIFMFLCFVYHHSPQMFNKLCKKIHEKDNKMINRLLEIKNKIDVLGNENTYGLLVSEILLREITEKNKQLINSYQYKIGSYITFPFFLIKKLKSKLQIRTRLKRLLGK